MVKIEIDITDEIERVIEREVEKQLDNGGILAFIRKCVKTEFTNAGLKKQVARHESQIMQLKKKLETHFHGKGKL